MVEETFSGNVGTRGNQAPSADHAINVAGLGTISAQLTWKGKGNLHLELYDGNGNLLASASAGASPESLRYGTSGVGQYTLRVLAVDGRGKYTLTVRHP